MVEQGLLSDTLARSAGVLTTEVGNLGIKDQRRQRTVPVPVGGVVADYIPFYFAPRSPMMYSISRGNVPSYQEGTATIIYLESTLERLHELGHNPVLTDRNAALHYAEYRTFDPVDLVDDDFIDWDLMAERYWSNTPNDPQRVERRMAEALAHERVSWDAILVVGSQNDIVAAKVRAILAAAGLSTPVRVRPEWYF